MLFMPAKIRPTRTYTGILVLIYYFILISQVPMPIAMVCRHAVGGITGRTARRRRRDARHSSPPTTRHEAVTTMHTIKRNQTRPTRHKPHGRLHFVGRIPKNRRNSEHDSEGPRVTMTMTMTMQDNPPIDSRDPSAVYYYYYS